MVGSISLPASHKVTSSQKSFLLHRVLEYVNHSCRISRKKRFHCISCRMIVTAIALEVDPVILFLKYERSISPVAGLECPRGFQEVKVPRFRDKGTGWW